MRADVCVIGAGPAGLSAAAVLARHGARVVVIDETPEPGGRLLGQLHRLGNRNDEFHQNGWWNGRRIANRLVGEAVKAGAQILSGTSVWGIFPGWQLCLTGTSNQVIDADKLLIATGATEVACPIPGWTLPGVMTVGAGQVLATQYRVRPGNTGVVVGINPLSLAISHELQMAGVDLVGVVSLPASPLNPCSSVPADVILDLAQSSHLAPSRSLRLAGRFTKNPSFARIAAHLQPRGGLRAWGIPIDPRRVVTAIHGGEQVEGVTLQNLDGSGKPTSAKQVAVDCVFLAAGLRPLSELAAMAGCRFASIPGLGGSVPLYGPGLETTVSGLYVAGNSTGVESAVVAMAQGRLAAASIVSPDMVERYKQELGHARSTAPIEFIRNAGQGRAIMAAEWNAFVRGDADSADPSDPGNELQSRASLPTLPDDLTICRCEEVTLGMLRHASTDGSSTAEELKRYTRITMGACQGRICGGILKRFEQATNGSHLSASPFPGHRPPLRPVSLGAMALLASGEEEGARLNGVLTPSQPFHDLMPGAATAGMSERDITP